MTYKEKLIYLAGFIDGEGGFHRPLTTNGRGEKSYQSRIMASNTDKQVIEWIIENFGGRYSHYKRSITRPPWKDLYVWAIVGKKAEALAKELQPYMIVKRDQIHRVLSLRVSAT